MATKKVKLFTDGACSGNPGPGGWCAILQYRGHERVLSGGEPDTTNNRMELTAVIEGLGALTERCDVTIYSDSKYFIDAIEKGWLTAWRQRGWRKADKGPVLNVDLWERIEAELERHIISLVWVKGHDGHPENERCDKIAVAESKKQHESAD